jgi:dipeptidyl aminopeptidase/acylaminoacyl peptidase
LRKCKVLIALGLFFLAGVQLVAAQQAKKPFTAALETELWDLNPERFDGSSIHFSPDKKYFVVYCQRGRLDIDRPEDSFRFYLAADVESFLKQPDSAQLPAPIWVLNLAQVKEGPNIEGVSYRWLHDSSGLAFLQKFNESSHRLAIADLKSRSLIPLTSENEDVQYFDIRDRNHYVYNAASTEPEQERANANKQSIVVDATGRTIGELMIPDDPAVKELMSHREYHLWAVIRNDRFEVKRNGAPFDPGDFSPALSPDGLSIVTTLPVDDVPKAWETLYPPPANPYWRIRAGHGTARQYVRIDLKAGSVQPLLDAPRGFEAGWVAYGDPAWSDDGKTVLLPNTFLKPTEDKPSRPCVAVVDLATHKATCVETLKQRGEQGFHAIWAVDYAPDGQRVVVTFGDEPTDSAQYRRSPDGSWQIERQRKGIQALGNDGLEMTVTQGINDPPLVVATNGERSRVVWDPNPQLKNVELSQGLEISVQQGIGRPPLLIASREDVSRVIWDPNPQLKGIELGEATVFKWKNQEGREFKGGLFKPFDYKVGQRYPLVIQTHGLYESYFFPSGPGMPTAFAARALAAAGIVVLQVDEDCPFGVEEGACAASAYESAVSKLASMGMIDPERVGIIGFSRSCYYVMDTLTTSSLRIKAASITSGLMFDYWQYAFSPDKGEGDAIIGAAPFGEGLQEWIERSPGFNLDKVKAPLMVVGQGPDVLLTMWAAYSGLRQLHKPVELVMLNSDEHVLTNPAVRMASQGGSVDWFRFWLQSYENPDPAKADQYKRWRELKRLQAENEKKSALADCRICPRRRELFAQHRSQARWLHPAGVH